MPAEKSAIAKGKEMLGTETFRGLSGNGARLAGCVTDLNPPWRPRPRRSMIGRLLLICGICLGAKAVIGLIWHLMFRDLPQEA